MKPDISSRQDIKFIITSFYDVLLKDHKMIPFFEEIVAKNHLEEHLDIISDFWNDILFDTNTYSNNVMQKHMDKNVYLKFKKEHFVIWMSYLFEIIDTNFSGKKADLMKTRVRSIATVMQLKMDIYNNE